MKLNKLGIRTKRQKKKSSKGVSTKGNKVRQQKACELSEELPSTSKGAVSKQLRSREFNLLIRCANQQFKEVFKQYTNNKKHFEEEATIIFNDEVSFNSMPLHLENNIEELNKIRAIVGMPLYSLNVMEEDETEASLTEDDLSEELYASDENTVTDIESEQSVVSEESVEPEQAFELKLGIESEEATEQVVKPKLTIESVHTVNPKRVKDIEHVLEAEVSKKRYIVIRKHKKKVGAIKNFFKI